LLGEGSTDALAWLFYLSTDVPMQIQIAGGKRHLQKNKLANTHAKY